MKATEELGSEFSSLKKSFLQHFSLIEFITAFACDVMVVGLGRAIAVPT